MVALILGGHHVRVIHLMRVVKLAVGVHLLLLLLVRGMVRVVALLVDGHITGMLRRWVTVETLVAVKIGAHLGRAVMTHGVV